MVSAFDPAEFEVGPDSDLDGDPTLICHSADSTVMAPLRKQSDHFDAFGTRFHPTAVQSGEFGLTLTAI